MPPPILGLLDDRLYGRQTKRQKVFTSLTPSLTITNFIKEKVFIERFSDSGEILLGFTNNFQSLVAFAYLGVESLADIYSITSSEEAFQRVFKKKYEVTPGRQLIQSVMLQSEDGNHIILLSSLVDGIQVIYSVSLDSGAVSDCYVVHGGYIDCFNIHLYLDRLTILLGNQQEFQILTLSPCGKLSLVDTIGEFSCRSDKKLASMYPNTEAFSALTHRLLVFWWRNAGMTHEDKLRNYFRQYNIISSMKMASFQFLDRETILIIYEVKGNSGKTDTYVFAVYNLASSEIEAIFDDNDPDLIKVLTENVYEFIIPTLTRTQASQISTKNRRLYEKFISHHLSHSTNTGRGNCSRLLPFPCQSYQVSPYFDSEYFEWSLDEIIPFKMLKCLEERCQVENDIIFLARGNKSRFCLRDTVRAAKVVFHPWEPVVLSGILVSEGAPRSTSISLQYHLHYHSSN